MAKHTRDLCRFCWLLAWHFRLPYRQGDSHVRQPARELFAWYDRWSTLELRKL